jgi:thiol-disulfide isomerase/thioredoxin
LRGRYVLLDFWASWCKPCRAENPRLVQLYQQYKGKGFEVYGVSLDESKERWLKAVAADKLPWVQVSDLQGFKGAAVAEYAAQAIPLTLLLDPQGRILAKSPTGEELQEKLAALLP